MGVIVAEITTSTHHGLWVLVAVALERISIRAHRKLRPHCEPGRLPVDDID